MEVLWYGDRYSIETSKCMDNRGWWYKASARFQNDNGILAVCLRVAVASMKRQKIYMRWSGMIRVCFGRMK